MEKYKKIQLIEPSIDDNQEAFRQELEEALGGWNCSSFDQNVCYSYSSGGCSNNSSATDFCALHSCNGKVF